MPGRNIRALLDPQAEQPLGGEERSLDHPVEREVRFDRGLVEIAAALAQLFRIIAPVPWREGEVAALLLHQRLQGFAIGERALARGRPHRLQKVAHCGRRFRHRIVEPVLGEIGVAEQPRSLGAKLHHLGDDRLVVGRAVIVAAGDESAEDLFAQIAPARELEEGEGARARQRNDAAVEAALLCFAPHRLAHECGQAGKFGLAGEAQREGLFVGEDVLAERGAECRQALHDLDKPRS